MFRLNVSYTDGYTYSSVLDNALTYDKATFTLTESDGIFYPTFTPLSASAVNRIEIEIVRDPAFFNGLRFLNSMNQTNDIVEMVTYEDGKTVEPKEFTVMKNADGEKLNFGFVTEQRFVSYLQVKNRRIYLTYEMEDKLVKPETDYKLEPFMLDTEKEAEAFLEIYADNIVRFNGGLPASYVPVGICTWSCFYGAVSGDLMCKLTDQTVKYAKEKKPNLIQIDDCWQEGGSFCGTWYPDKNKFPDMKAVSDRVRENGMDFGLWVAPLIVNSSRKDLPELEGLLSENDTLRGNHPYDFSKPEVYEHLKKVFKRLVNDYKISYFKLDFLWCAIKNFTVGGYARFDGEYAMYYYRKALKAIREAVGDKVYLLACGAPLLATAGILNAIRTSSDIVWGRSEANPTYWELIKKTTVTNLYRYFYHGKVFTNDADGLCVRDFDNGDGFNASYSEARLWATTVAMSGGPVLINEDLEEIGPSRRALFTKLLPPLGKAAKPFDYFEAPYPSSSVINIDEDTKILALYRWEDEKVGHKYFHTEDLGIDKPIVVDTWESTVKNTETLVEMRHYNPHSACIYLIKRQPKEPAFLFSDINVWGGINVYESEYKSGTLTVYQKENYGKHKVYVCWPTGFEPEGTVLYQDENCTVTLYEKEILSR